METRPPSQNPTLTNLPSEIWSEIISAIPSPSLPNLTLTSLKLYQQVNPKIYQYIHFSNVPLYCPPDEETLPPFPQGTKIISPSLLHRTITKNILLRSSIQGASITWTESPSNTKETDDIKKLIGILSTCNIKLHLYPSTFCVPFILSTTVTSLVIPCPSETTPNQEPSLPLQDSLYAIFTHLTLRHLVLQDFNTWSFPPSSTLQHTSPLPTKASNIQTLILPSTTPPSPALCSLLSWPKNLTTFRHNAIVSPYTKFFPSRTSSQYLIESLMPQYGTLTSLTYHSICGYGDEVLPVTFGALLKQFVSLKRMKVSVDCLFIRGEDREDEGEGQGLEANEMLLSSIEEIILELDEERSWEVLDGLYSDILDEELRNFIRGIAKAKPSSFPRLKRVVLWQDATEVGCVGREGCLGDGDLRTDFLQAGINLEMGFQGDNMKPTPEFRTGLRSERVDRRLDD